MGQKSDRLHDCFQTVAFDKNCFQDIASSASAVYTAATKGNTATKDTSKKSLENELQVWFGNARDRGEGCRKLGSRTDQTRRD